MDTITHYSQGRVTYDRARQEREREGDGNAMISEHGPNCDVCGDYILLDKSINPFKVAGILTELHCHDKCVDVVKNAFGAKDWRMLPDGRLR